jgi:hypothetical protein
MTTPNSPSDPETRVAVITGATGLVGTALVPALERAGFTCRRLVRRTPRGPNESEWHPDRGSIDSTALEGAQMVVNLAGENIAQRWTSSRKQEIMDSRVRGTSLLVNAIGPPAASPRGVHQHVRGGHLRRPRRHRSRRVEHPRHRLSRLSGRGLGASSRAGRQCRRARRESPHGRRHRGRRRRDGPSAPVVQARPGRPHRQRRSVDELDRPDGRGTCAPSL